MILQRTVGVCILLLLMFGGILRAQETTYERVQRTGSITLVADRNNLPYAAGSETSPGIDVELAQALATAMEVRLYYHWINTLYQSPILAVADGKADIALGVALDTAQVGPHHANIGTAVQFTIPYYTTGYVMVTPAGTRAPGSLRDVADRTVGVERGAAVESILTRRGLALRTYPNQMAVLLAIRKGDIAAGALWADAGYLIREHPGLGVRIAPDYVPEPELRVPVGGAIGRGDRRFASFVNTTLERLIADGIVTDILKKYSIPYYPPAGDTP